jgi:arylsulfatase A-like enzyme
MKSPKSEEQISRRTFLKKSGTAALALTAGSALPTAQAARDKTTAIPDQKQLNILMIVTDQERHLRPDELPIGYRLPGHEKLMSRGVTFDNHQIASCVCTPSRAVVYTGQHIQNNGMFDNTNFPWSNDLSTDIPTIGDMMRQQGYYTAYKGKWHLTDEFETANDLHMPKRLLVEEMEEYGFSDYFGIGDMIAHTEGGFLHDGVITSMSKSWLRGKGSNLGAENKPWFMAVNLVNPHDVMYYNTDLPGQPAKQAETAMMRLNREHATAQFSQQWNPQLPVSRNQPVTGNDRPAAHDDFAVARSALVGRVPNEDDRWSRLNNYYFNCLQDADRHVLEILDELDDLGMSDNTIVIFTADHGELAGAHGLSGKGANGYREQQNVPFIISHPDYPGGKHCKAVTSHLDIATTLIGLAGGEASSQNKLQGKDISPLLQNPESAAFDAVRPGALFNYNMLAFVDGDFLSKVSQFIRDGGKPSEIPEKNWRPDLAKRGAIRNVYDGRYKLNRYFSPQQHHMPQSIEALFANNDVELFDLKTDPNEMNNLATNRRANGDLLIAMNDKLNALIESEVGEDNGQMLPAGKDANWKLDPSITKLRM